MKKKRQKKILSLREIKSFTKLNRNYLDIDKDEFINLVNICTGLYSPLENFSNLKDVNSILKNSRISRQKKWTIPILLSGKKNFIFKKNKFYQLKYQSKTVGCIKFKNFFKINKKNFSKKIFNTFSKLHPGVNKIYDVKKNFFIDCECFLLYKAIPKDKYFKKILALKKSKKKSLLKNSVAFSTRNICHKGHEHIHKFLEKKFQNLFIVVIQTSQNKYNPRLIYKTYELLNNYKKKKYKIISIFLPLFFAGPKEAFIQSQIIKNIGITSFLVGRDHAGVKNFYGKYSSQEFFSKYEIKKPKIVKVKEPLICLSCFNLKFSDKIKNCMFCNKKTKLSGIDGKNVRNLIKSNEEKKLKIFLNSKILNFIKKNKGLI